MARLAFDLSILRILLVEDDTFARELEKTALLELGVANVHISRDTAEALDALERGVPCDLIVADWNMLAFDGRELVTMVHARWPGLSILMLTNNEGLEGIQAARDAGVDGCLIKPFSLAKLREAIQLALVTRLTRIDPAEAAGTVIDPQLTELSETIRKTLAAANAAGNTDTDPKTLADANRFADRLTRQLDDFIGDLGPGAGSRMVVAQLHLDCLRAVLSGRPDLLDHETQNLIVDGLSFAADLVAEDG